MFWLCFLFVIDTPQTSRPSDLSARVPLFITQVRDEWVCQLLDRKQLQEL